MAVCWGLGGVCRRGVCLGGVCLGVSAWGCLPRGCLPRGCLPRGVCPGEVGGVSALTQWKIQDFLGVGGSGQ